MNVKISCAEQGVSSDEENVGDSNSMQSGDE
jgi:hypothetical protein